MPMEKKSLYSWSICLYMCATLIMLRLRKQRGLDNIMGLSDLIRPLDQKSTMPMQDGKNVYIFAAFYCFIVVMKMQIDR